MLLRNAFATYETHAQVARVKIDSPRTATTIS